MMEKSWHDAIDCIFCFDAAALKIEFSQVKIIILLECIWWLYHSAASSINDIGLRSTGSSSVAIKLIHRKTSKEIRFDSMRWARKILLIFVAPFDARLFATLHSYEQSYRHFIGKHFYYVCIHYTYRIIPYSIFFVFFSFLFRRSVVFYRLHILSTSVRREKKTKTTT